MAKDDVGRYLSKCKRGDYFYGEITDGWHVLGKLTKV
jgi:hypothetical protein